MFNLELDMVLYFVGPMAENADGIRVTRQFELPFAPTPDVFLSGFALNGDDIAMGYKIEDIHWDIDRAIFFAHTCLFSHDIPLAFIPLEVQSWLDRGWRLGSYEELFGRVDGRSRRRKREPIPYDWDWSLDDDEVNEWPRLSPQKRPPAFNMLLKAIVRELARADNNLATAYAIAKSRRYFTEFELESDNGKSAGMFRDALAKFQQLDFDQQYDWKQRVVRRYPRLEQFIY